MSLLQIALMSSIQRDRANRALPLSRPPSSSGPASDGGTSRSSEPGSFGAMRWKPRSRRERRGPPRAARRPRRAPGRRRPRRRDRDRADPPARRRGRLRRRQPVRAVPRPARSRRAATRCRTRRTPSPSSSTSSRSSSATCEKFWAADFQQGGPRVRARRGSCSSARRSTPAAARARRRPARSTARPTARSTSTSASSASSPPASSAGRLRAGLRARARVRPPHPDAHRRSPSRSTAPRARTPTSATRCPCGSSCRPTASPACGRTRPSSAGCSRRATSRRG